MNNFRGHNVTTLTGAYGCPFPSGCLFLPTGNGPKKYFDGHFFLIALATI
jgi:hypothetical protein